ncbi:MAG TPA: hypothetical protein DCR40_15755 [Prolixibacteraceae bacterium]|nr:hypothetical protein [Prolixibacteraceae bacterium]
MNERLIQNLHNSLKYELKAGTKGSFYKVAGQSGILPERLNWGIFAQKKVSVKDSFKLNEINAKYKKNESGAYKGLNNGSIHTSIWKPLPEYPEFYGYGILDERAKIFDLLIIYSENVCSSTFEIHIFKGMGKKEYLEEAFRYLRNYKKKKPHF